jgi:hypothetical protein
MPVMRTESMTTPHREEGFEMQRPIPCFEYACHEGNTAVRNYIETSRYERSTSGGRTTFQSSN